MGHKLHSGVFNALLLHVPCVCFCVFLVSSLQLDAPRCLHVLLKGGVLKQQTLALAALSADITKLRAFLVTIEDS